MQVPSSCLSLELTVSNFSGLLLHFLYKFKTTSIYRLANEVYAKQPVPGEEKGVREVFPPLPKWVMYLAE